MKRFLSLTMGLASLAFAYAAPGATPAMAGTVILEGSDAIGLHSFSNAFAATYRDQVWSAIGGADPRPIAVVGTGAGTITSGTHAIEDFATLDSAGVGALSGYAAIYFVSGGGCCSSDPGDYGTRMADVAAYVTGGGTAMIENYDGNAGWDFLTGGSGNNAFVAGVGGGLGGSSCSDGENVTGTGTTNGFTQPGAIGCWTHQAYDQAGHFAALGFTKSFFDAGPDYPAGFSSLLSNGSTVTGATAPEPSTWATMLIGFAALGYLGFRKSRTSAVIAA